MDPQPHGFDSAGGDGDLFRLALEAAPAGMLMIDRAAGGIMLVNAQIERLFGYAREELIGRSLAMLVPERYRAQGPWFDDDFFRAAQTRPMSGNRELFGLREDGREIPVEISLTPVRTPKGDYILASIVDITERQRAIEQLRERSDDLAASLKERDVLLQEVHHRVKNNLQVISSLINMQIRKGGEGAPREVLTECKRRVEAIGLIHEKLYQSHDYARVPFSDYARSLARNIVHASDPSAAGVDLRLECDDISLPVDKAISCGLILNELITSAMKHVYPDGVRGQLRVDLHRVEGGKVRLTVKDSGTGMPEQERGSSSPLGLQLVSTLTAQLDGSLLNEVGDGTSVSVEFPVSE
jgi:PAS domain S-box-containing protein